MLKLLAKGFFMTVRVGKILRVKSGDINLQGILEEVMSQFSYEINLTQPSVMGANSPH